MNPEKVDRAKVEKLTDLPNVGKSVAADLEKIGIECPQQLEGVDPFELYVRLCRAFGQRQDPCMLDVLMSIVDFMDGAEPKRWWAYTELRKRRYGEKIALTE
jgi:hypothetical protein